MSIKGYDQWKTASPYDDEYDPTEEAQKVLNSYRLAKTACDPWEENPGLWKRHLEEMEKVIEELVDYIINN